MQSLLRQTPVNVEQSQARSFGTDTQNHWQRSCHYAHIKVRRLHLSFHYSFLFRIRASGTPWSRVGDTQQMICVMMLLWLITNPYYMQQVDAVRTSLNIPVCELTQSTNAFSLSCTDYMDERCEAGTGVKEVTHAASTGILYSHKAYGLEPYSADTQTNCIMSITAPTGYRIRLT